VGTAFVLSSAGEFGEIDSSLTVTFAAGDGTTNCAFGDGEKELYVTVVKDPKDARAKGSIVKIANVQ
jgi:hypothetical protein